MEYTRGMRFDAFDGGGGGRWSVADVADLDQVELEELAAALYRAEGMDVERAAPNVEGGVRVIARDSGWISSTTVVVAPTPADHTVSSGTVSQLERSRSMNGADRATLIRPAPFDPSVREATTGTKVDLVDGEALVDRLNATDLLPRILDTDRSD